MARFLTTRFITSELESIITEARSELVLISPYIKIADNLFPSLQLADQKKVNITLVYGKKELESAVREQLLQLEHLTLRFLEKLHAKCYYNERKMIISSLNLYDFSEGNFEMGILVDSQYDPEVYPVAKENAELIIKTSRVLKTEKVRESPTTYRAVPKVPITLINGYCIRGKEPIPYDVTHPLCLKHYDVWKEHSNIDFKEHYCHRCGERHRTSFKKALCIECYKKENL